MNWKSFVADKSLKAFRELVATPPADLDVYELDERDSIEYADLRAELLECDERASHVQMETNGRGAYSYDLEFGLGMYKVLTDQGFGLWQAADNGVWSYLSIKIIPDIVYKRWKGYNEDRFYKRSGRIWLKSLWWYVYLTEDGNAENFDIDKTRELLKNGSEDIIYLLLDHSKMGFRDEVYHALFRRYAEFCKDNRLTSGREDFFRALFLQHQIKSAVMDPLLDSPSNYVDSLFKRVLPQFMMES